MKKSALIIVLAVLAASVPAQQIQEETSVTNVEIPVRVFQGERFVDDLGIGDFEVLEDGKPVTLEAVYLIKRRSVERRDEVRAFAPRTNRSFYLIFEMSEVEPKMGAALREFMRDVIMPGDTLTVATPYKTYKLKERAFEARTREEIAANLEGVLRRDTIIGSAEYRSVLEELAGLVKAIVTGMSQYRDPMAEKYFSVQTTGGTDYQNLFFDDLLNRYTDTLGRLEGLREVNQAQMLAFADLLKKEPGQKHVYMFYQREYVPKIDPKVLYQYIDEYQDRPDINMTVSNVFEFYKRDVPFNVDLVKRAFADASTAIHFLLLASPTPYDPSIHFREQSEDIFSAFSEMSKATGGFAMSSANPAAMLRGAVESADTYYLLYYAPRPYVKDGKFRTVTVRVNRPKCRLVHRMGYFAN